MRESAKLYGKYLNRFSNLHPLMGELFWKDANTPSVTVQLTASQVQLVSGMQMRVFVFSVSIYS